MKLIKAGEPNALFRRIYFDIRNVSDGVTPVTTELGKQPQISVNGNAFGISGISPLSVVGNGIYYADLDPSVINGGGTVIKTIYIGAGCVTTPGDTVLVVDFDPDADIASIKTLVGTLPAAIAAVDDKCVVNNQGLAAVTATVNTISTSVTATAGKVDGIATTQNSQGVVITSTAGKVNGLATTLGNVSAKVDTLLGKVSDVQTKLAENTTKVDGNTAQLTTIISKIDAVQAVLDAFLAAFKTLP